MGSEQSSNKESQQNRRQQYERAATGRQGSPAYTRPATASSMYERSRHPYSYAQDDLQRNVERRSEPLYPNLHTTYNPNTAHATQHVSDYVIVTSGNSMHMPSTGRATAPPPETPPRAFQPTPPAPPATQHTATQPRPTTTRPAPRNQRAISRDRRNGNDVYNCPTCNNRFGLEIFSCPSGHSSCRQCRVRGAGCGVCGLVITDTRNYAMQDFMAQVKVPCPNAADGCTLQIKTMDIDIHAAECPFAEMACPVNSVFGNCRWRGKASQMLNHFDSVHPEQRQGDVDTELILYNICYDNHTLYFVPFHPFNFVFHVKVDLLKRVIYMTAQLLGTGKSAAKWNYEVHVYNKREPRRKYTFVSTCTSASLPFTDVFNNYDCMALPLQYALSFVNEGILTYKFFIKKVNDNSHFTANANDNQSENAENKPVTFHNPNYRGNARGRGRGRGRGRAYYNNKNN